MMVQASSLRSRVKTADRQQGAQQKEGRFLRQRGDSGTQGLYASRASGGRHESEMGNRHWKEGLLE